VITPEQFPPPIRTDGANVFAAETMRQRFPALLESVIAQNDYPPLVARRIARLRDDIATGQPLPAPDAFAADAADWAAWFAPRAGQTWHAADWLFAEVYIYRLLMDAVRWRETGRDPFAPRKEEEFASPTLWSTLEAALSLRGGAPDVRLHELIALNLWGNRIDLSFNASLAHGMAANASDYLADDRAAVVAHLLPRLSGGVVDFVCDNAGTELALDLALADAFLDSGALVRLHLKDHPTYVSDTVVPDVWRTIALAGEPGRSSDVRALAGRLRAAFDDERLRLLPDPCWNSPLMFWQMPQRAFQRMHDSALVIVKGDANYRRLVGDGWWTDDETGAGGPPLTTPFADVLAYFPRPLLALRTMKSDPVVGVKPGAAAALAAQDALWRVNGKRGVAQFKGQQE
jgi:hypothetical protein